MKSPELVPGLDTMMEVSTDHNGDPEYVCTECNLVIEVPQDHTWAECRELRSDPENYYTD